MICADSRFLFQEPMDSHVHVHSNKNGFNAVAGWINDEEPVVTKQLQDVQGVFCHQTQAPFPFPVECFDPLPSGANQIEEDFQFEFEIEQSVLDALSMSMIHDMYFPEPFSSYQFEPQQNNAFTIPGKKEFQFSPKNNHYEQEEMWNCCDNPTIPTEDGESLKSKGKKTLKRPRESSSKVGEKNSDKLSRKVISGYFYMPITQAAKELNVGLTLLKKRCRELGIRRWPHRKLMSLMTLIKNIRELGKADAEGVSIQLLEREMKLLEEIPDMQLEEQTKKLRQACFKANYKKRKLIGMVESSSSIAPHELETPARTVDQSATVNLYGSLMVDDEEDLKYLLYSDCLSSGSSGIMF